MSMPAVPEYAPAHAQPQPPKKKFNWKLAGTIFAAVLIGGVVGSAVTPTPDPVIHVQEKVVEKEVTPESCLEAMDRSEEAFRGLTDALTRVMDDNYTAANRYLDEVTALVPEVNAAKAECRASQ